MLFLRVEHDTKAQHIQNLKYRKDTYADKSMKYNPNVAQRTSARRRNASVG